MPTNRHGPDWVRSQIGTAERLNRMKNVGLAPGSVAATTSSTIPTGWLLCDGRLVSRTTYADLFAAIGTDFGVGDGATTFGLPDLRGRFLRGRPAGGELGAEGGSDTHTLEESEIPAHTHTLPGHTHSYDDQNVTTRSRRNEPGRTGRIDAATDSSTTDSTSGETAETGDGAAHNNLPAYRQVDWIIKHAPLEDKLFTDWMNGDIATAAKLNSMRDLAGVPDGVILASGASSTPDTYSVVANLRGRFLRGRPDGGALDAEGGSDTHTLTVAELPMHKHELAAHTHSYEDRWLQGRTSGTTSERRGAGRSVLNSRGAPDNPARTAGASPTPAATGGGGAHENRPSYRQIDWLRRSSDALSTPWADGDPITAVALNTMKNALLPAGLVAGWVGHRVPTGWLLCDGRAVSRTTYADLFDSIGTTFGAGDGSTTFRLPDLRGRFLRGRPSSGTLGAAGGSDTHELTVAELPAHTHVLPAHTHTYDDRYHRTPATHNNWSGGFVGSDTVSQVSATLNSTTKTTGSASPALGSVGDGGAHNNLPSYRQVDWIISI